MKKIQNINMNVKKSIQFIVFLNLIVFSYLNSVWAEEIDENLATSLKIEASHNLNRIKSYAIEADNNKIFENEREKGLGEFFEDQEKWDLIRERGLQEYLKQKQIKKPMEGTPEHQQYLKESAEAERQYEKGRKTYVATRNKIQKEQTKTIAQLEDEELQLKINRPRYDLLKRSRNKWVSTTSSKPGSGSASSSSGYQGGSNQSNFPPPAQDYPATPGGEDGFNNELPPAPVYDNVPYDPSFSGDMSLPPPPPPPPPDYDF